MNENDEFINFSFSVLPSNTSGSVAIPLTLSPTPTTLATLTMRSGCDCNCAVALNATVGWLAVANGTGLERVDVLFKIWRGVPLTNLVFSALDSAESGFDSRKLTSFNHVDTRFGSSRFYTYYLTAELPNIGSAATVIGPITFTATEIEGG